MTIFGKNDVFRGGRRTFWTIISEWLNFNGRGFQNVHLGSLLLLVVYEWQTSNEKWGSYWILRLTQMHIFYFEPFNWYTWRTTHCILTLRNMCLGIVWASGYYCVGSRSRPLLNVIKPIPQGYTMATARTNMLKLFGYDAFRQQN